jgi:hypothetical protein
MGFAPSLRRRNSQSSAEATKRSFLSSSEEVTITAPGISKDLSFILSVFRFGITLGKPKKQRLKKNAQETKTKKECPRNKDQKSRGIHRIQN